VKVLKKLRARFLLVALISVTVLGWTARGALTAGALKGNILPVVSTSDVIGYVSPCG
jgi:hypothetical protein